MDKRYQFFRQLTLYIIFFIVLIYGLVKAEPFIIPLLLAVLFAYLLFPIAGFLEKKKVPRILSILVALIFGIVVLVAAISFLSSQIAQLTTDFPQFKGQATSNINKIAEEISSVLGISTDRLRSSVERVVTNFLEGSGQTFQKIFSATTSTIVRVGLMPVFVFFMLYYRSKVRDFILEMVSDHRREQAESIIDEINLVMKKYMTGILIVVLILSVAHSVAFNIIGLQFAILLGVIAALFNFIPYFGTLIGAVFPLLYGLLTGDSLSVVLYIAIYFVIIQFVENNILTPNITGGKVRLNPFVTILSLILGSMLWGVAGMFIIIPYMAMIRIFCDNVDFLKPIGFLLSDRGTEKYAITGDKIKNVFKKD